jgi:hypothetical protein
MQKKIKLIYFIIFIIIYMDIFDKIEEFEKKVKFFI